jgi:hypothetical protein
MKNFRIKMRRTSTRDLFYAEELTFGFLWNSIFVEWDPFGETLVPKTFYSREAAFDALKNYIKSQKKEKQKPVCSYYSWYYSPCDFE